VKHRGAELPRVTISLGVAAFPDHAPDFEAALKLADEALYAAKARGRNRVVLAGDAKPLAALAERAA
jgi:diguanylate cyclase (GGDEF)-like protein